MGDVSNEPSMEDILSSIKRIIAEEGDAAVASRPRRASRSATASQRAEPARAEYSPPEPRAHEEEVLELIEPVPSESVQRGYAQQSSHPQSQQSAAPVSAHGHYDSPRVDSRETPNAYAAQPSTAEAYAPPSQTAPQLAPEPILSPSTAEATRDRLNALSRMALKPEIPASETSLEGLVREMIRPMLREWLDMHLPHMVEEMVQREISRIANGRD